PGRQWRFYFSPRKKTGRSTVFSWLDSFIALMSLDKREKSLTVLTRPCQSLQLKAGYGEWWMVESER
ncbi:MAG TPA: hypothetical protein PK556_12750, partial [Smithellaceae bacterium]|nr:hypothetical protein [Smithellaceae bacterium]